MRSSAVHEVEQKEVACARLRGCISIREVANDCSASATRYGRAVQRACVERTTASIILLSQRRITAPRARMTLRGPSQTPRAPGVQSQGRYSHFHRSSKATQFWRTSTTCGSCVITYAAQQSITRATHQSRKYGRMTLSKRLCGTPS